MLACASHREPPHVLIFRGGSVAKSRRAPIGCASSTARHIIRTTRPASTSILADPPRPSGVMIVTVSGASRRWKLVYDPR
jgi:hypothetical protein